jgi:large subunit ribosomal protein L3
LFELISFKVKRLIVKGLIGIKRGMTRIFDANGIAQPVTVLEVDVHTVVQLMTQEKNGYEAIQVTTGNKSVKSLNGPEAGQFKKRDVTPGLGLWEFRGHGISGLNVGDHYAADILAEGDVVDVQGVSKGKGFAGTVKRWNFRTQDMTHGNSRSHRVPGSIGQNQTPGRVFKGKKMCGHLGDERVTVQSLNVLKVDAASRLLLIRGAVPGSTGSLVIVKNSVKNK